ncbi:hypothetical protein DFH11DRAFT_916927 [Phellopilus nigrolimitatus]|nr:hypothetical protein DFH11DRAFT_916927 [Phellopilus nigrolimitatus]
MESLICGTAAAAAAAVLSAPSLVRFAFRALRPFFSVRTNPSPRMSAHGGVASGLPRACEMSCPSGGTRAGGASFAVAESSLPASECEEVAGTGGGTDVYDDGDALCLRVERKHLMRLVRLRRRRTRRAVHAALCRARPGSCRDTICYDS